MVKPLHKIKEVSAAIFLEKNKVLLTKRGKIGELPGYWEFPGGKREENETIFECLEREIFEELCIRCKAVKIFAENIYKYDHITIKLIAIIAELIDTEIVLKTHVEYQWVDINDLFGFKLAPADVYIAELLLKEFGYV